MNTNLKHATTILCVRKNGETVIACDGQITLGDMICKNNANKIRLVGEKKNVIVGFAGSVADALTLISTLEDMINKYQDLERSVIELSKGWRTNKQLRHLEASIIAANASKIMVVGGNGEVMEEDSGISSVGSGSHYALAAAKALQNIPNLTTMEIVKQSMAIAGELCVYTNQNIQTLTLTEEGLIE